VIDRLGFELFCSSVQHVREIAWSNSNPQACNQLVDYDCIHDIPGLFAEVAQQRGPRQRCDRKTRHSIVSQSSPVPLMPQSVNSKLIAIWQDVAGAAGPVVHTM
jgi:hypothetical protein